MHWPRSAITNLSIPKADERRPADIRKLPRTSLSEGAIWRHASGTESNYILVSEPDLLTTPGPNAVVAVPLVKTLTHTQKTEMPRKHPTLK